MFRLFVDVPIKINSGFRCVRHNYRVSTSSATSYHQAGSAIDMSLENILKYFKISTIRFMLKHSGFTFIKYYADLKFMHADVRCLEK